MIEATFKLSISILALLAVCACASQERLEPQVQESKQCRPDETLTCDEFAAETYNCSCEKGDNLRDMLDAYRTPNY